MARKTSKFDRCVKSVRRTVKARKGSSKESAAIAICTKSVLHPRGRTLKRYRKGRLTTQRKFRGGDSDKANAEALVQAFSAAKEGDVFTFDKTKAESALAYLKPRLEQAKVARMNDPNQSYKAAAKQTLASAASNLKGLFGRRGGGRTEETIEILERLASGGSTTIDEDKWGYVEVMKEALRLEQPSVPLSSA